jgi:hypothetical protein
MVVIAAAIPAAFRLIHKVIVAGLHSVCGQGGIFLEFRGGEFSTGDMGNSQSALTKCCIWPLGTQNNGHGAGRSLAHPSDTGSITPAGTGRE